MEGCGGGSTGSGGAFVATAGLMGAGAGLSAPDVDARGLESVAGADAGEGDDFWGMGSGRRSQISSAAFTNTAAAPIHIH